MTAPTAPPRPRRRRVWLLVALVLGLPIAAAAVAVAAARSAGEARLSAAVARLDAGSPWRWDDLRPKPIEGPTLAATLAEMPDAPADAVPLAAEVAALSPSVRPSEDLARRLAASLDSVAPQVARLRAALGRPVGSLPAPEPAAHPRRRRDDLAKITAWAAVLRLEAARAVEAGRFADAVALWRDSAALVELVGTDPTLEGQRARLDRTLEWADSLLRILGCDAGGATPAEEFARARSLLVRLGTPGAQRVALPAERALILARLEGLADAERGAWDALIADAARDAKVGVYPWTVPALRVQRGWAAAGWLDALTDAQARLDRPLPEQVADWGLVDESPAGTDGRLSVRTAREFEQLARAEWAVARLARAADALVGCEQFRRARADWPATLAEVVPAAHDEGAFRLVGGTPLKLARLDDRIRVLYTGEDGKEAALGLVNPERRGRRE